MIEESSKLLMNEKITDLQYLCLDLQGHISNDKYEKIRDSIFYLSQIINEELVNE